MEKNIKKFENKIILGDALEILKTFPDECIDLIVTSPPYYNLRNYQVEGQIGLEQVFDCRGNCGMCYMCKLLAIMRELKRVLKPTGSIFWNHGDAYGGSVVNVSYAWETCGPNSILKGKLDKFPEVGHSRGRYDKCLLMQPERFAIRCVDELGLILRNKIVWCLDEDTKLIVRKNGEYGVLPIKELAFNNQNYEIPALSKEGIKWIRIKNVWYSGKKEIFEIELTNGKRVKASAEHLFPTTVWNWRKSFIKLSCKRVKDLDKKNDKFYVVTKIDREGKLNGSYEEGLLIGWYLAEGSGIWTQNPKLTVNKQDLQVKELQVLIKKWNLRVKKQFHCNAYDLFLGVGGKGSKNRYLVNFIRQFILGKNCNEKRFTDKIWNMSDEFLNGVIDGFLKGDGNWDEKNKRWRIRIKYNPILVEQIETICLLIGRQFRKENNEKAIGFSREFKISSFSIQGWGKRTIFNGLSFQRIRNIKSIGVKDTYDIEIEPVYLGRGRTNKASKDKKKEKWNNIFVLANGIITHNCKQVLIKKENKTIGSVMPSSVRNRLNESWEYFFFFVKSKEKSNDIKNWLPKPLKDVNASWLAAIIDGEGTIGIRRQRRKKNHDVFTVYLIVSNTCKEIIDKCFDITKVGRVYETTAKANFPLYQWKVESDDAISVIGEIYPYLIQKREQAKVAIALQKTNKYKGNKGKGKRGANSISEKKYQEKIQLWELIKKLNKKEIRESGLPEPNLVRYSGCEKYYSNLDAVRIPHQVVGVTDLRPPGIIRQALYPKSKYHQNPDYGGQVYKSKFFGMGQETKNYGSPIAKTQRKRNKTLIDPNAKGLRQAPEPGEPNAFHPLGKNLPTVFQINPEPHNFRKEIGVDTDHFAVMPETLVEIPIEFACPPDGIVLDPFCGSGTTCVVAKKLGRKYIGIELNPDYIKIAEKRLEMTGREFEQETLF